MRLFAVAGSPILPSKSPFIFKELFKAHSIDAHYTRIGPENPEELFFLAEYLGLEGFNITSPFKESVFPFIEEWDDQVEKTGSVNTIIFKEGRKKGFNTDLDGVSRPLINRGLDLTARKGLVLGAGGAGKAAALALRNMGANVVILNRNVKKARDYGYRIGCLASGLDNLNVHLKDTFIVVNTIREIKTYWKDLPPGNKCIFFDAVYNPSALEGICPKESVSFIPGEEWLLSQACRSFEIFTGIKPEDNQWHPFPLDRCASRGVRRNVSLIGFMGCGKTSVGEVLAAKLGFSFLDTDSEIEREEGMTVGNIFRLRGEPYFREKEKEVISRLEDKENMVIACGGGAVLDEGNRRVLRKNSFIIWLFARWEESSRRLKGGKERPLLKENALKAQAERIFQERKDKYFLAADLIISSERSIKEVARKAYEEVTQLL